MLTTTVVVVVPLVALGHMIRRETNAQLRDQFSDRVSAIGLILQHELSGEGRALQDQLEELARAIQADNRFRRATVRENDEDRNYLLDYASRTMRLTALDILQIQNDSGRILSSGHFRNEYGRLRPGFPQRLNSSADSTALVVIPSAEGSVVALTRSVPVVFGSSELALIGGVSIAPLIDQLGRDANLSVTLEYPGLPESPVAARLPLSQTVSIPFIDLDGEGIQTATIRIVHSDAPLLEVYDSVNSRILVAIGLTLVIALVVTLWLARLISRPFDELAAKTARVDLDRLDISFASPRNDEIGTLSRLLDDLMKRLRTSTARIRDIERRAAVGDLARQVNHDIKNGLTPLKNVFQHLAEVSRDQPDQLQHIFAERRSTIESSIDYLGKLAANYARLTPQFRRDPCDLNGTISDLVAQVETGDTGVTIILQLTPELPAVISDRVMLHRIVENLLINAVDAVERKGTVTISTYGNQDSPTPTVRFEISDTGTGMTEQQLEKAFEDFFTTKKNGTGLGLSVVRRLVLDLGGSLRVETEPEVGTRFIVEFPTTSEIQRKNIE